MRRWQQPAMRGGTCNDLSPEGGLNSNEHAVVTVGIEQEINETHCNWIGIIKANLSTHMMTGTGVFQHIRAH